MATAPARRTDDWKPDLPASRGGSKVLRPLGWGAAGLAAVAGALLAVQSDSGARRLAPFTATGAVPEVARSASSQAQAALTAQALGRLAEAEREAVRLAEQVRTLTADRDKLAARVGSLEAGLEDLSGSITLTIPSRRPPVATDTLLGPPSSLKPPGSPPGFGSSDLRPPPLTQIASIATPPSGVLETPAGLDPDEIPLPRPKPPLMAQAAALAAVARPAAPEPGPEPAPMKRHAVELGGAAGADVLKVLWTRLREGQNKALVADLEPSLSLREAQKPGLYEMRLVAGPLPDQASAHKLCASLVAGGVPCRATTYDGQLMELPRGTR